MKKKVLKHLKEDSKEFKKQLKEDTKLKKALKKKKKWVMKFSSLYAKDM